MNKTLFKYIFKMQINAIVLVSVAVFFMILLFDFAEVTRKYPISNLSSTIFAIRLSLLRTPLTFCEILHYVYFITAISSLWNLCRSHQITILKSIGRSPTQILYPFFICATFIAATWLLIVHPIGVFSESQYNKRIAANNFKEVNHNIWIDCQRNSQVIFIKNICDNNIDGLYILDAKNSNKIFAQKALIEETFWVLENVTTVNADNINHIDTMTISNGISLNLIKLLSKPPWKHDIYSLHKIYKIQKSDGVLLKSYELELHKLLSNCFCFLLFALIAAVICLPVNHYQTKTNIAIKVISTSIFLRFANNVLESFACRDVIPVQLACWSVFLICACISSAILVWREI